MARRLLVLAGDRIEKRSRRLAAREAGAPVALLVEVGEDGVVLEEPPDPSPRRDDDVAHVGQRLERRSPSLEPGEPVGRGPRPEERKAVDDLAARGSSASRGPSSCRSAATARETAESSERTYSKLPARGPNVKVLPFFRLLPRSIFPEEITHSVPLFRSAMLVLKPLFVPVTRKPLPFFWLLAVLFLNKPSLPLMMKPPPSFDSATFVL